MTRTLSRRSLLAAAASLPVIGGLSACAGGPRATDRTHQLVWSTYGVGTGTYNDLAAVANTLTQRPMPVSEVINRIPVEAIREELEQRVTTELESVHA